MEYGLIPKVDQYRDNKAIQLQKINSVSESSKLSEKKDLKELNREEFLNAGKTSEIDKVKQESKVPKFEYTLTNTNFGFNDDSKDFYIKVRRGNAENQFPTEQMMRLKSYILSLDGNS